MIDQPEEKTLIIYKASAGTGKTFTLVKEYLKLLIQRPAVYQHILAITFTNAATLEMKTRVIEELIAISKGSETDMLNVIREELGYEEDHIVNNAKKALSNILHDYSRFEISTIDSFFNRVVRNISKELGIPVRYLIELEPKEALKFAIRHLYESGSDNEHVIQWFRDYAYRKIEDKSDWKIDNEIAELGKKIFEEKYESFNHKNKIDLEAVESLKSKLEEQNGEFESTMTEWAEEALELIRKHQIPFEQFRGGSRSVAKNFEKIRDRNYENLKTLFKIAEGIDTWYTKPIFKDKFDALGADGLDELTSNIYDLHNESIEAYKTNKVVLRNIYAYALLEAIRLNVRKYRDEHNVLLLSDNAVLINQIIGDSDAPFIFEKLGSFYKHIFIDEFQDTSGFQWENMLPLIRNSLSEGFKVFVVGDVKQSIYRWRGGNLQLLLHGIERDLDIFSEIKTVRDLRNNWRSGEEIVQFSNRFFGFVADLISGNMQHNKHISMLKEAYGNLQQEVPGPRAGYVELSFLTDAEEKWKVQAKNRLLRTIDQSLRDGYGLKDILILTNSNDDAVEIANFLIEHKIHVLSQSALLLNNIPVIQLILNVMAFIQHPQDQVAKASTLYWYNQMQNKTVAVEEYQQIRKDRDYFLSLLPEKIGQKLWTYSRLPAYELIEELAIQLNINRSSDIFLQTFKELCLEQAGQGIVNISEFLDWWYEEDRELTSTASADVEAIRVMTIHKSKGLEAPIVIIPFADFDIGTRYTNIFWTDNLPEEYASFKLLPLTFIKETENSVFADAYYQEQAEGVLDGLNKAYVAFTRPREKLYVFTEADNGKSINIRKLNALLQSFARQDDGNWDPLNETYTIGESFRNVSKVSTAEEVYMTGIEVMGSSYQEKIRILPNSKNYYLLQQTERADKVKAGIKRHAIMERLNRQEELEKVMRQLVAEGFILEQEIDPFRQDIKTLFENTTFRDWFSEEWEVRAEKPIFSEGKVFKPDRVITNGERTVVIDYKKEVEDPKHEEQISNYAHLLERMGYQGIEKYLVYMDTVKIKKVG